MRLRSASLNWEFVTFAPFVNDDPQWPAVIMGPIEHDGHIDEETLNKTDLPELERKARNLSNEQ